MGGWGQRVDVGGGGKLAEVPRRRLVGACDDPGPVPAGARTDLPAGGCRSGTPSLQAAPTSG